jgi:hypothetical protein
VAKNGLRPVADGELIVAIHLPKGLLDKWDELQREILDRDTLARKLTTQAARTAALGTLFWDEVSRLSERTETAEARGKNLGIRVHDGAPVIVEADAAESGATGRVTLLTTEQFLAMIRGEKLPGAPGDGG